MLLCVAGVCVVSFSLLLFDVVCCCVFAVGGLCLWLLIVGVCCCLLLCVGGGVLRVVVCHCLLVFANVCCCFLLLRVGCCRVCMVAVDWCLFVSVVVCCHCLVTQQHSVTRRNEVQQRFPVTQDGVFLLSRHDRYEQPPCCRGDYLRRRSLSRQSRNVSPSGTVACSGNLLYNRCHTKTYAGVQSHNEDMVKTNNGKHLHKHNTTCHNTQQ